MSYSMYIYLDKIINFFKLFMLFNDEILYKNEWHCIYKILYNECYNHFHNLRIILLVLDNFKDKIVTSIIYLIIACYITNYD